MNKQRGATFLGMLIVAMLVVLAAIVAAKLVPSGFEYWSVRKVLAAMANDPAVPEMSARQLRESFDKRASIDNITSITGRDLEITREGGQVKLNIAYAKKIPLGGGVSICLDLSAASIAGRAAAGREP